MRGSLFLRTATRLEQSSLVLVGRADALDVHQLGGHGRSRRNAFPQTTQTGMLLGESLVKDQRLVDFAAEVLLILSQLVEKSLLDGLG